ncbi:MAG: hypothetical protein KC449_12780 [Anaerolineales bacterium]|nr:hypothetical protein [Anaerolineales bacterium]
MLHIRFNNGAPLRINLPRANRKQDIVALAQAFVAHEATLPEGERTPFTARMETAVAEAITAQDTAQDQEAARKAASEALKRTQRTAKRSMQKIRSLLAGHFAETPEQAQAWGFMVRQTGRSAGQILMPRKRADMIACLHEYIQTETARPEAERFLQPPLADLVTLHTDLVQQEQNRNSARLTRLQENGRFDGLIEQLFDDLRLALSYLMLVNFEGVPDRNLANWGFEVVARSPRPTREEGDGAPPGEDEVVEPT